MRRPESRPPDRPLLVELDRRFAGVNEREEPGALPGSSEVVAGAWVTEAINARFESGSVVTRDAVLLTNMFNPQRTSAVVLAEPDIWEGKYTGAGIYVDMEQREYVLAHRQHSGLSADPGPLVYASRENADWFAIPCGTDTDIPANTYRPQDLVHFAQLGGDIIMWRGGGRIPLLWDGDRTGDGFVPLTELSPITAGIPSYYDVLPAAPFGIAAGERFVFPIGAGAIGWTPILEARRWDSSLDWAAVGDDGGEITGLAYWRERTLIVFKERSVWAFDNWTGDLSELTQSRLSRQAGCISHSTIAQVGGDLLWLGTDGVYRLEQVLDNVRQLAPVPVSWHIPRTMARVNWSAARQSASAALSRGLYYLAVPLDGSPHPDTLLVWDSRTEMWQGKDELGSDGSIHFGGNGWLVRLLTSKLWGRESLQIVNKDAILSQGSGYYDGNGGASGGHVTSVTFRGYVLEDAGLKTLHSIEVETEELGTEDVLLEASADGRKSWLTLQAETTRDRAHYTAWGRADRDLTNAGDDFDEADREDYSWKVGEQQVETATVIGTITGTGNATVILTSAGMTGSPLTTSVSVTAGTNQVETGTVAVTAVTSGFLTVTVTAAGMVGSPVDRSVAVLNGDTAAQVATKIRDELNLDVNITDLFTVGGTGAIVTLTRITKTVNDATLNIAWVNDTSGGITTLVTSVNTTAGVSPDTASAVATKIRTALNLDDVITERFTIGGSGADITLTRTQALANDATLNLSINNGTCTGLTPDLTSTNTTAGVEGDALILGENGVTLGILQTHQLRGAVTGVVRHVRPRVSATRGRLRINAVRAGGMAAE